MKLKKFAICAGLAGIIILAGTGDVLADNKGLCGLITKLQDIFKLLRTLAFIGAAFILASWAWDLIKGTAGDDKGDGVMDTLKKKGISMIVGFTILFAVGIILQFLLNGKIGDCNIVTGWD